MPKISIIIPTYNGSKFIKRAINSVISQTINNWELLIVDDCSMDDTIKIVKEFYEKDSRIKLLKTPKNSGGPSLPKNIGLKNTTGEYVAFLDQDDEWLPEKLEKQLEIFENLNNKKIGLVSCGANLFNKKNKCFSFYKPTKNKVTFPEILLRNPIHSNSSVLIKNQVLVEVGERDENMKYSEDWDMWIRIIQAKYEISFVHQPLFNYYFHDNNVSKTLHDRLLKVRDAEYIFKKHNDLYLKYNYIHIGYFRLGIMYFLGGDSKKSRLNFKKSFKLKKYFIPAYIGYFLSFLNKIGISIINFLIFLYRIIKGRVYLIKAKL